MAAYFWVSKAPGGWSGPTGAGTESSPFLGAIGLRNAFNAGTISAAGGHVITFMGEYGPVLLAEIAADFPNTMKGITEVLTNAWPKVGPETPASCQGGIIFGNANGNSSNCKDNVFKWRGGLPYHVDARGATTNAQRMSAAVYIQGNRNRSEGLRMAQPDWDWIGGGTGRVPATVVGAASFLAHESSYENFGLVMHGWGCQIDAGTTEGAEQESTSWGSDAFGRTSFRIVLSMFDSAANAPSSLTYIQNTYSYGMSDGPQIVFDGGQVDGTPGNFPQRFYPAAGARAYNRWNRVGGLRWGDRLTTPLVNNTNQHGNMLNMASGWWERGAAAVYGNECWGFCQDTIEVIGGNHDVYDNWIHDISPGFAPGANILYWTNSGGNWVQSSGVVTGSGIKLGLGSYEGQLPGTVWPSLGTFTNDFGYEVPAFRNRCFRNLVENNTQNVGAIVTNGSNGAIIHGNEIIDFGGGIYLNRTGAPATDVLAHWVSNNYVQARQYALLGTAYTTGWFHNNIFDGATSDFYWFGATNHTLLGTTNRFVNNNPIYGTSPTNLLQNTLTGAADYTQKVGPTPGGNSANAGSWQGVLGARAQCVLRDKRGRSWGSSMAVGPYRA